MTCGQGKPAWRRSRLRRLWGTLWVLLVASSAGAGPDFRAPYSGERVSEYEVVLPVGAEQTRRFRIPAECGAVHQAFGEGAWQWGNRVERRLWNKVLQDCYFYALVQRGDGSAAHDYVSGYDFMNADLRDLLAPRTCDPQGKGACGPLPPGMVNLRDLLLQTSRHDGEDTEGFAPESCVLDDGLFRGWVRLDGDTLSCRPDRRANGFRIVAVDLVDIDADGYMDALIRFIPLGNGVRHIPLIFPVTRTSPTGPFSLPGGLARY